MLISCKCLNFVANTSASRSNSVHQFDKNNQLNLINNRQRDRDAAASAAAHVDRDSNGSSNTGNASSGSGSGRPASDENRCNDALTAELVNAFLQKYPRNCVFYSQCMELLKQAIGPVSELSVTIHQRDLICMLPCNSWILNICINCNTAICAKHTSDAIYLLNSNLLMSHDELVQRKVDKSFSETFGILIMNHQQIQQHVDDNPFHIRSNKANNRLRSLTQNLQSRLQKEIADTDERIHRYTEQQFALLKSFREKSEQEYQILVSLVNQVPEQLIDAMGTGANSVPTTPTITTPTKIEIARSGVATSNNNNNNSSLSAMDSNTQASSAQSVFSFNNKKVTSFDTPPATPESTPMSVGNSPTFNRQQQTSIGLSSIVGGHRSSIGNGMFYINSSSSIASGAAGMDADGDCLFELEGVESYSMAPRSSITQNMSDVEESAEDAEDALAELEASIPIPGSHAKKQNMRDFARSLPIAIANSVNEGTLIADSDDDILEDNVDIAASIKALAKSVHGDAVFGDLPRPRLKSQI
ncbi:uncharacterized protein LOC129953888 [Eupeodes corollae]|uniref:uncharacterized protein LOC129953888 n=1 Tax=Eupeodes corollae TaxID=290404 RepID=UPI002490A5E8|nr:uncharacterized protein LOC129953888 [Eupeodes corollae]